MGICSSIRKPISRRSPCALVCVSNPTRAIRPFPPWADMWLHSSVACLRRVKASPPPNGLIFTVIDGDARRMRKLRITRPPGDDTGLIPRTVCRKSFCAPVFGDSLPPQRFGMAGETGWVGRISGRNGAPIALRFRIWPGRSCCSKAADARLWRFSQGFSPRSRFRRSAHSRARHCLSAARLAHRWRE